MREGVQGQHYTDFSPENIFLGLNAGLNVTPGAPFNYSGKDNVFLGNQAGISTSSGRQNIFIGPSAGITNTTGRQNIFIGMNSGYNNISGYGSTIIGYLAGYNNRANLNVFIGNGAGHGNTTSGLNTYLGNSAGYYQTSGGGNAYFGSTTAMSKTGGDNNTMIGTGAGAGNGTGSGNVFLGYQSGFYETGSNKLYIANSDTSTPLIHGDFSTGNIGLGKQAHSSYRLDVLHNSNAGNFYANTSTAEHTRGLYARSNGGTGSNYGIFASASGSGATNYAGWFSGDIRVTGNVTKSTSKTTIDHPFDPENRKLSHSSVESSDRMRIYSGNVVLDSEGFAEVMLPEWFEAVNKDIRYQLTAIGAAAPNLHISTEIQNNSFKIGGGANGMKVSWIIHATRNDNYARSVHFQTEEFKREEERGFYIHPEAFGKPSEMSIEYQREKKLEQIKEGI